MAYLEDILKKLGWDDGFQIPVANAENQQLEEELARLVLHKIKAKNSLDNSTTRLSNLKDHHKYVKQENEQTQKLITAHKQQYDTEENQYHIIKAEKSRVLQDVAQVNKRIAFLEERTLVQRHDLEQAVIKVEKTKQETGWDIEALKAWEEALKKRDDDNEMIKRFSKEDERRFNELEARRQFLQGEYDAKTLAISKIACELHSCEMIIERTGKAIKQQLNERDALIKQWKEAVKMLQQRDAGINVEQDGIMEAQSVLEKQKDHLDEENTMLKNEQRNNHDIELEIEQLSALHSRMRRELDDLEQNLFMVISESHSLKRGVASAAQNMEKLRMKGKQLSNEIDQKEKLCIKDHEDVQNLEKKIREMKGSSVSSEERIKKIQKMIDTEEKQCKMLLADTEKINSYLYRTDQLLKDQQSIGKTLEIQINNAYCICNKLRKHIRDEKKSLEKLKEVVYDMQYRIDEFEQKLCKLEGSNKQEEHADEKEDKIRELEKISADHAEVQHTLQAQVDRLQDEMRKLSNFIATDKEQLEILQNKVENHLLVYEIGKKQIASAKKSTQEKQVEENVMRLRINHIEGDMEKEENKIFNLQKLRLTLDQVMKERQLEIETSKSVVLAKRRNLDDEKGRLKCDISLRKVKLDQLQKKYHIELMSLGKDDDGQPLSVTHFKIKHAQEKFMMQQEGDELDQKIKVAEKEILAVENTLKVVNLTNVAFRNNLSPLKEQDAEVQEMKVLESMLKESMTKLRNEKQELTRYKTDFKDLYNKMKALENEKLQKKVLVSELEEENLFIEKQEKIKEEKLNRTERQLRKALKKLQGKDLSVYEQDLEIRQLKEANNSVIKKLYSMTTEYLDVAPNINKYSEEHNINLKSQTSISTNSFSTASTERSGSSGSSPRSLLSQIMVPITIKKVDISLN